MSGFLLPGARRKHNIDTVSRTRRRPTGPCAEEAVGGAASTSVASDCAHQESLACQPLSPRCPQTCEGETGKAVNVDNGLLIRIDNPPEMRESICRDRQACVFFFFLQGIHTVLCSPSTAAGVLDRDRECDQPHSTSINQIKSDDQANQVATSAEPNYRRGFKCGRLTSLSSTHGGLHIINYNSITGHAISNKQMYTDTPPNLSSHLLRPVACDENGNLVCFKFLPVTPPFPAPAFLRH